MKLEELVEEGWKSKVAGAALAGAVAAGVLATPPIKINGVRYERASVPAPADAKVVVVDGKKYKVWDHHPMRNIQHHVNHLYVPIK